jgi:hypothetical protein
VTIATRGRSYLRPQAWQLAAGPGDGRWGVQAVRYDYMNGQCRYCGDHCGGSANSVAAHPRALCLACGTPQCDRQRDCLVCMIGFVGRVPYGMSTACGYAKCGKPAVARAPRVGRACAYHLAQATSRRQTLADGIANSVRLRELGGLDWQQLAWFGPERRYAVRRWHDDGRAGWVTGKDPKGFETAGAADREALAWNDPKAAWPHAERADGWHAERVVLTDELRAEILAWAKTTRR